MQVAVADQSMSGGRWLEQAERQREQPAEVGIHLVEAHHPAGQELRDDPADPFLVDDVDARAGEQLPQALLGVAPANVRAILHLAHHLSVERGTIRSRCGQDETRSRAHDAGEVADQVLVVQDVLDRLKADDLVEAPELVRGLTEVSQVSHEESRARQPRQRGAPGRVALFLGAEGEGGDVVPETRRVQGGEAVAAACVERPQRAAPQMPAQVSPAVRRCRIRLQHHRPPAQGPHQRIRARRAGLLALSAHRCVREPFQASRDASPFSDRPTLQPTGALRQGQDLHLRAGGADAGRPIRPSSARITGRVEPGPSRARGGGPTRSSAPERRAM